MEAMKRNEAIVLLEEYNKLLMKEGFADNDLWCEPPTAIDLFLNTEWAKENLPIKEEDSTPHYSIDKDPLKCIKCNGTGIHWLGIGSRTNAPHYVRGNGQIGFKCDRCDGRGIMI